MHYISGSLGNAQHQSGPRARVAYASCKSSYVRCSAVRHPKKSPSSSSSLRQAQNACLPIRSSRQRTVTARADASNSAQGGHHSDGTDEPLYLPATASTYCPFSAELLLATTRLGHLERYREEVQQLYEPGMQVDLTRVALLISNIYQPQLDHRTYFDALEHLVAAATLGVMRKVSALAGAPAGDESCSYFNGLDLHAPQHVLCAVHAINELLFEDEGLGVNAADPYDPLNGSLADLLDSRKGNQWTLAILYLQILDGLGLPCAVVGSPDRIFVRVGEPPLLLQQDGSSSSLPAALLVDMSQPGVVCAYPPPVPAAERPLQTADSLASCSSTSSTTGVTDEWNQTLHAFLQQHQQQLGTSPTADPAQGYDQQAEDSSASLSSSETSSTGSSRANEFDTESLEEDSSAWQELEVYSAQDAATRNSWKALYGPGALTEWGGSVSRTWNSFLGNGSSDSSSSEGWQGPEGVPGADDGATIAGMRAAEWLGVLESPFAAAAAEPFSSEGVADEATSSMDTSCGSPTGSIHEDSSYGSSSTASCGGGCGGGGYGLPAAGSVVQLSWGDVAAVGGLQPVSKRMMLQQMLGGMKLSLMMSGRQEELLMVLRYLRATDPFSLPDLRDMALCLAEQRPEEALPLLREYLAVAPGAADHDMVCEVLAQVQLRVQLGRAKGWQ